MGKPRSVLGDPWRPAKKFVSRAFRERREERRNYFSLGRNVKYIAAVVVVVIDDDNRGDERSVRNRFPVEWFREMIYCAVERGKQSKRAERDPWRAY